jgi:hypothetical protein
MATTMYDRMSRRINQAFWTLIAALFGVVWFAMVGAIVYVMLHFVYKFW